MNEIYSLAAKENKQLEEWTAEEVQNWLLQNKEFAKFAPKFEGIRGKSLAGFAKDDLQKELGNLQGSALFNAVAKLKGIYTFVLYQAIIFSYEHLLYMIIHCTSLFHFFVTTVVLHCSSYFFLSSSLQPSLSWALLQ